MNETAGDFGSGGAGLDVMAHMLFDEFGIFHPEQRDVIGVDAMRAASLGRANCFPGPTVRMPRLSAATGPSPACTGCAVQPQSSRKPSRGMRFGRKFMAIIYLRAFSIIPWPGTACNHP